MSDRLSVVCLCSGILLGCEKDSEVPHRVAAREHLENITLGEGDPWPRTACM